MSVDDGIRLNALLGFQALNYLLQTCDADAFHLFVA